eukprot:scaffold26588_cov111-Isochrysis_galbana.AAC.1
MGTAASGGATGTPSYCPRRHTLAIGSLVMLVRAAIPAAHAQRPHAYEQARWLGLAQARHLICKLQPRSVATHQPASLRAASQRRVVGLQSLPSTVSKSCKQVAAPRVAWRSAVLCACAPHMCTKQFIGMCIRRRDSTHAKSPPVAPRPDFASSTSTLTPPKTLALPTLTGRWLGEGMALTLRHNVPNMRLLWPRLAHAHPGRCEGCDEGCVARHSTRPEMYIHRRFYR